MDIQKPHDKFFKATFGNVETAKDFPTNYLPEHLLQLIDVNTLKLQKDSYINETLEEQFSDLLIKATISNREGYFKG